MRNLGLSSYSLYLTHAPIVAIVCEQIVAGRVRPGVPYFVVSLAIVLPLTIAFARLFASVFEIPFMRGGSSSRAPALLLRLRPRLRRAQGASV
jgi:peptidoglycan/LPS O-acetylase OafA/YrhL